MKLHNYQIPEKNIWKGRDDGPEAKRIHQIVQMCPLTEKLSPSPKTFAFLGFACDEGVRRNQGNIGAAQGPAALRQALAGLPSTWSDNYRITDCGDIVCNNGNLEKAQKDLAEAVATLLAAKMTPIIFGGGHEVAWGHYQGIMRAKPKNTCSIVNFDAHYDLRPKINGNQGNSGTPFLQIAEALHGQGKPFSYNCLGIQPTGNTKSLFDKAKELGVSTVMAEDFHAKGSVAGEKTVTAVINDSEYIYLTVCMDVFATPYAPGVSARQPLGVLPWHVIPLIRQLAQSGKVLCMDIAELSPLRDREGITAQLAASLIHTFIAAVAK